MNFEPTYEFLEDNLLVVMHDDGRYHLDEAEIIFRRRLAPVCLNSPNDWFLFDKHDAFVIVFKFRTTEAFTMAKVVLS